MRAAYPNMTIYAGIHFGDGSSPAQLNHGLERGHSFTLQED